MTTRNRNGKPPVTPKKPAPSRPIAEFMERALPKLFVLDTNVLMHDPTALYNFAEHDVCIPMIVLEELDNHKKGNTDVARNTRQTARMLDDIVGSATGHISDGIDLYGPSGKLANGRLFLQTENISTSTLPDSLSTGKADNQIIGVVMYLQANHPDRLVILVSKDINMRIKARALGLRVQDYFNDKVLEDTDVLPTGTLELPENFWPMHGKGLCSAKAGPLVRYSFQGPLCSSMTMNQFVFLEPAGGTPLYARVRSHDIGKKSATIETIVDYGKHPVWGITARNREQNFALNLLMDPEIDFVMLLGQAGTGKTLLTLAAALEQTLENSRLYSEIIFTRVTVPVGEDIGFLPGTEEEKMSPWMGALEDNLDVLNGRPPKAEQKNNGHHKETVPGHEWGQAATMDLIRSRIKIKSLNFMRGRTFLKKFLIIDEAQNLTPKQMKTLITRAGPGTKVVCLGNLAQIDTPYLTEGSSGLTYVVDRFKGWEHSGHVTLQRGERSRLADHAAEVL